jgi:hypothetical protein
MLIDAELYADMELDAMAWRSDPGCAQRESRREVPRGVVERSVRREVRVMRGESSAQRRA